MHSYFRLVAIVLVVWNCVCGKQWMPKVWNEDTVSIVFGGDVDFSRIVRYTHRNRNCSYDESLRRLKKFFTSADFSMINLETTISEPEDDMNDKLVTGLWSEEAVLPAIKASGVSHVTLANNHIMDFRESSTNKTCQLLKKYKIKYSGVVHGAPFNKQKPLILEKNGIRIGILSYCDLDFCHDLWDGRKSGAAILKFPNVIDEVNSLKSKEECDVVVLFMHWGIEFASIMAVGVVDIIRKILKEADVDLIVGAHPHVTQKHWYHKKTLIAPSLGNLLFTPYVLANFNFNEGPDFDSDDPINFSYYEKIWYKQMRVMADGTQTGRLMKVVFNKSGVVREKSKWLPTRIFATKEHCLAVKKEDHKKWRTICRNGDPQCTGTSNCNYIECDRDKPLPEKVPPSPMSS